MDEAFGHWFAGFTDGEGCFQIIEYKPGRYDTRFLINLRADDIDILHEIRNQLGMGTVFIYDHCVKDGRKHPTKMARFQITNKKESAWLVEIFDSYPLRAKKRWDYLLWREAVKERFKDRPDWGSLCHLQLMLRAGRKYH